MLAVEDLTAIRRIKSQDASGLVASSSASANRRVTESYRLQHHVHLDIKRARRHIDYLSVSPAASLHQSPEAHAVARRAFVLPIAPDSAGLHRSNLRHSRGSQCERA